MDIDHVQRPITPTLTLRLSPISSIGFITTKEEEEDVECRNRWRATRPSKRQKPAAVSLRPSSWAITKSGNFFADAIINEATSFQKGSINSATPFQQVPGNEISSSSVGSKALTTSVGGDIGPNETVSPPKRIISSSSQTHNQVASITCGNEFQYTPSSPKWLVPVATRVLIIQVERERTSRFKSK